jgi:hypothetical protein
MDPLTGIACWTRQESAALQHVPETDFGNIG